MADIDGLQDFARDEFEGLTSPLDSEQVEDLVNHWLPEMRFYEQEHFYPISLRQCIRQPGNAFDELDPADRDDFRVVKLVRSADGQTGTYERFDPPVLCVPDGFIAEQVQNPGGGTMTRFRRAWRVLASGTVGPSLELGDVDGDAVVTHGASFGYSDEFFGPKETLTGQEKAKPADPWKPRLRPLTVIAAYFNLIDALEYELLTEAEDDYPPDGLRGGFDIASSLLRVFGQSLIPLPAEIRRAVLLRLIQAYKNQDDDAFGEALEGLVPFGVTLDKLAWDLVTRMAFAEYYFFYPFNDFDRYQTTPFENEHEGDDEGCCLVFERNAIEAAAASGSNEILRDVTPHSIITSVHEEFHDSDLHTFLPAGKARDELDLVVWIAAGSHATYLSPGTHDLVDFGDVYEGTEDKLSFLPGIAQLAGLVVALLAVIVDHFVDTEDYTSDDGVHSGPEDLAGDHDDFVPVVVQMLPMSADRHIYQESQRELLRLRAFAGKWGGHHGSFDISPPFAVKTGRYFRRLLKAVD